MVSFGQFLLFVFFCGFLFGAPKKLFKTLGFTFSFFIKLFFNKD